DEQHTTTNLALFRHYAEEYLQNHPNVAQNEWLMARELEPTAHGLPLQLWFYLNITEFVLYEQTAAEIMEYLIASLPKFNLKVYQYYLPLPN
ncbi:MAG: mechanosensitive ion channel protein, partial [Bacteroidaceae bacterium]|nr:mechanosensitive ion channel protein [Bacteroidaceae bacterium]